MLNKVTDYKILCSTRTSGLESMVRDALAEGWALSGPVFEYKDEVNQVMIKFGK